MKELPLKIFLILWINSIALASNADPIKTRPQFLKENYKLYVTLDKVYDGDTVYAYLHLLPPPLDRVGIRLRGIDTPEKGHRAECDLERERAENAKVFVETVLGRQQVLLLTDYDYGKFGGRIVAHIIVGDTTLSDLLIKNGHAVPYDGKKKTHDFCKP